jgi:hypothetical protein
MAIKIIITGYYKKNNTGDDIFEKIANRLFISNKSVEYIVYPIETLKKLYGIDDPKQATNFQLSTAKYYKEISPTIPKDKDINLYSSIRESREKDVIQQKQIGDQILKEFNQSRKPVK